MIGRVARGLGWALLGLVVLATLLVVFALNSRWAVRTALPLVLDAVPVDIAVEGIDGTVADGITLTGVRVTSGQTQVNLGRLDVTVDTRAALSRTVVIPTLTLTDVVVRPPPPSADTAPQSEPFALPELEAPVPIRIDALRVNGLRVTTLPDYPVDQILAALAWQSSELSARNLSIQAEAASVSGHLVLDTDDDGAAESALRWSLTEPAAAGQLTLDGPVSELSVTHTLSAPAAIVSDGRVRLAGRVDPEFEFVHTCASACGVPDVDVTDAQIKHTGTLADTALSATGNVAHARLPTTRVTLTGRWFEEALSISTLTANGNAVRAEATGRVLTKPALAVTVDASLAHLDASLIDDAVRGSVTGKFGARYGAEGWQATLTSLAGTVNDYALSGRADLSGSGRAVRIRQGEIALGDNRVTANGRIDERDVTIDAALALKDLAQIDARLGGSADGTLMLAGPLKAPQLKIALDASTLRAAGASIAAMSADVALNADGALEGTVTARQIEVDDQALGEVRVDLAGTRDEPDATVAWSSDAPLAGLKVNGELGARREDDAWIATLSSAEIASEALGQWVLAAPFEVRAGAGDVRIGAHRWQGPEADIDVQDARIAGDDTTLRARLLDLPLASFDPFLPDGLRLRGTARANIDLSRATGQWQGNVSWAQDGTVLGLRNDTASRRLALSRVAVNAILTPDIAHAVLDVQGERGVAAAISVAALSPADLANSPLDGTVTVSLDDIGWLGAFVAGVEELAGSFALDGTLTGTGSAPVVRGAVSLDNGTVALSEAGIRVEALGLSGTLTDQFTFAGQATSGGGTLTLDGEVTEPWSTTRQARLTVRGENVQVLNDATYQVRVSPDLDLRYTAKDGARVAGRVDVPEANVRIEALPESVVAASSDIRVAGREVDEGLALPVNGEITIALGDDVHVYALGLDTDLGGDVRVRLAEGRAPRLDGRLSLSDGTFKAYGQDLAIERGNVIYAGPIDNPTLDLRATRTINDPAGTVTAGVNVSGVAQQPDVVLYSDPALSETDTLSYLLLGRAADDTSGVEGEALSQAALAFGMSRSSPITQQLADGLGLDELTVGGDSVDAAELVAGKQINDRLYLRYTYGVFSNLGAILLRYRLSRRLTLEAGSADAQSLDLLYTIEK
ncbi:MAG: translocation/assembly module TamB domain-containing protein [Pseudomonadota bacterium]